MAEKQLYLLDGMALVYRAHFALIRSPIYTSYGLNSSALYGFVNTLLDITQKQKPTHLAVVFDTAAPTERHALFPEYKGQRQEMPEDLSAALPHVKRLVEAFNLTVITLDGYEADDIIGTLARRAEVQGDFTTYMVTPDKDFAQLVSETTLIYKPGRQGADHQILGLSDILDQWEIERPDQVIDIIGLWGDASDNIPGIPGVGEKTAKKLIKEFGSIESLLQHSQQLKGKLKANVETFGEQALLSKKLATIITDAPVEVDLDDLRRSEVHDSQLRELFVEFEFNTLGKRVFGDGFEAGKGGNVKKKEGEVVSNLKRLKDVPHQYHLVVTPEDRKELIAQLSSKKAFSFEVETSTADPKNAQILGIAFSWQAHEGYYLAFPIESTEAHRDLLTELQPLFDDPQLEIVGHNLKFALTVLAWHGVFVKARLFDTMLAHTLIEPDQRHGLSDLATVYLNYQPVTIADLLEAAAGSLGLNLLDLSRLDLERVADYAVEDADVIWQVATKLRPLLKEKGQLRVYNDIEIPLLSVLTKMEREGIALDTKALEDAGRELGIRANALRDDIFHAAGDTFNLDSPKQLGEVLFDRLNLLEKPKKTKTGQYATNEQVLTSLLGAHPIISNILDYRETTKLKNTYVDSLPKQINPRTGRVHTTFHQLLAVTGRLQSQDPNLQNIPIRSAQGREIRKAFIPGAPDQLILSADYSQIELRVMASLSGDVNMKAAFQKKEDIHATTAAAVYRVGLDQLEPHMRRTAKMVNFGIIYGISAFGLSQRLGISRTEAKGIIEEYFKLYPGVKSYMNAVIAQAKLNGYVETITGRRRYLRDINSGNAMIRAAAERTAINTPIQGSAADMIKLAMIQVDRALTKEDLRSRMLLQVHDELIFNLCKDEQMLVPPLVEQCMREALPLDVPVVVEMGIGPNWLAAH